MRLSLIILIFANSFVASIMADTMLLSTSSGDYDVTNVFSNVDTFTIDIEINLPLEAGLYVDPEIINVTYAVSGSLVAGTPSGFPSFALQRNITGTEFYQQGSSLSFEISPSADLSDGVQASELIDNGFILTLNAREVDNGRFHPALLELYSDGTGRIQNSNNVPSLEPLLEVNFGDEYITDLTFQPENLTLITITPEVDSQAHSGSGSVNVYWLLMLLALPVVGLFLLRNE